MKKKIHPNWYTNVPVIYEGKIVMYTESTCECLIVKNFYTIPSNIL